MAEFEDPAFRNFISSMALSPDSNSLYVATVNELLQFSLKDAKVIKSRNILERQDMKGAAIFVMRVTRNNQCLLTDSRQYGTQEKGTGEDLLGQEFVTVNGQVCVWSTKDLAFVRT